jgi:hypothetical protein
MITAFGQKLHLTACPDSPGRLCYDMSPQQLFQWRRQAREGTLVVAAAEDFAFAEVQIAPPGLAPGGMFASGGGGDLQVSVGGVVIQVNAATDLELLGRVVRCLRDAQG